MRSHFTPLFCAVLFFTPIAAMADAIELQFGDNGPSFKRPLTLATALKASPPRTETFLAIGAENITLPKDAPPPGPQDRALRIGLEFGCITRTFHDVVAIAPATMTVFNPHPRALNPYAGVPAPDAFRLLIASLDKNQWTMLVSPNGIGASDLSTEAQAQLFIDLFPAKSLSLYPQGSGEWPKELPTLSRATAAGARLRLARQTSFAVSLVGKPDWRSGIAIPLSAGRSYQTGGGERQENTDTIYGDALSASVPNTLKDSDLDYDADTLSSVVDLSEAKTVGELITRIGVATHLELYADARLEKQTVLILGLHSGRARDFLKATALGVRGTFRKVGPAYVLTNDRVGLGAHRLILGRFLRDTEMARKKAMVDATDTLAKTRSVLDQADISDNAPLSDAQIKEFSSADSGAQMVLTSFSKLTPEQQAIVEEGVQKNNAAITPGFGSKLTTAGSIILSVTPSVTLTSPSIDGLVDMTSDLQASDILNSSMREEARKLSEDAQGPALAAYLAERKKWEEDPDISLGQGPAPRPVLDAANVHYSRRAVIVRLSNIQELDRAIAVMKRIGFNQLWLDVFSNGESHLHEHPDMLEQAISKTRGSGIIVVPHLDVLNWGESAPEGARDLTTLGETSIQEAIWRNHDMATELSTWCSGSISYPEPTDLRVSMEATIVKDTLTLLLRRLAATPGVDAIALRNITSPGYGPPQPTEPFGYTPQLRLACLRKTHIDPLDISDGHLSGSSDVDVTMPEFQETAAVNDAYKDWNALRAGVQSELLQALFAAARSEDKGAVSLFLHTDAPMDDPWYGLWEDPASLIPQFIPTVGGDRLKAPPTPVYAHAHWRRNIAQLLVTPGQNREELLSTVNAMAPGWDGFVVDFTIGKFKDPFGELSKYKRSDQK